MKLYSREIAASLKFVFIACSKWSFILRMAGGLRFQILSEYGSISTLWYKLWSETRSSLYFLKFSRLNSSSVRFLISLATVVENILYRDLPSSSSIFNSIPAPLTKFNSAIGFNELKMISGAKISDKQNSRPQHPNIVLFNQVTGSPIL